MGSSPIFSTKFSYKNHSGSKESMFDHSVRCAGWSFITPFSLISEIAHAVRDSLNTVYKRIVYLQTIHSSDSLIHRQHTFGISYNKPVTNLLSGTHFTAEIPVTQ
jgi:hypothetical protein